MRKFTHFFFFIGILSFGFLNTASAQCGAGQTLDTYCYAPGEVDNVAFEICPTAGMVVSADIVQGSFFTATNDNLSIYSGASGSGTSGVLVFGPATGNVAGNNGILSTVADECLIFVVNSNTFGVPLGCSAGTELPLQVCSQSVAAPASVSLVITPDEFCSTSGVQSMLGGGTPTGGVYSGTGVTDDGNGMTFSFDPATAGVGTTTITYTQGGNPANDDIEVIAVNTTTFTALADLCIDAGVQTNLGGASTTGGTFSGTGVTDNGDGTYNFNPAVAGLGVHTITYSDNGICMDVVTDQVEVLAACGCPAGQTNFFYCAGNNESNTVAFEVCPTAGMAAQATITGGTLASPPITDTDQLNVYSGASGSGTGGTLLSGPLSGDLTGEIIMGSVADECLIFVISTGPTGSCQDLTFPETGISVCGESIAPSVSFVDPGDFCETDGIQTLGGGLPTGGVYSGPGVTDDGNGTSFSFDPSLAGVGSQTLTYTLGGGSDDVMIEVFAANLATFTALNDLCIDAGVQTGLSGGSPAGGTYSGTGVTDNGDGTYDFNPAIAGLGVHIITYTEATGCMSTATDAVEVLAACGCPVGQQTFFHCQDNNEVGVVLFEICPTDPAMAVQASITAGTYGTFIPDDNLQVYSGLAGSGTAGNLLATLNGNLAGENLISECANGCLTFVSNTGPLGSCQDGLETALSICASDANPPTKFTAPADICVNAGVQAGLGGGTPTGGVYSGSGVTDDGNGMTYSFDPAAAGVAVHTITYTANGYPASDDIEVYAAPTIMTQAPANMPCEDDAPSTYSNLASPTGGVYSGTGVTDQGNGVDFIFDPTATGAGIQPVTYTFTDGSGCTNTATINITVNGLPTVAFTAPADLCVDAGVQAGLGGGTPTGGVYSGTGVTDDGNGTSYSFDPAAAGVGTHTITYTFTDGNGCTNSSTDNIEVFALPTVIFTALADLCIDAGVQAGLGGGTPPGGTYSGTGVTDDGNGTTYSFDPAAAGVGTHTITYTYTDNNGCSSSDSDNVEVFALPNVTLMISETVCENDGIQTGLGGGSPSGGVYSGTGVTDDGNGMTFSFDPSVGPDGYPITYTYTDANGCANSSTTVGVIVNEAPTVTFTALADLCENDGVQSGLGGGTPTGGTYSGPGVTDDGNGMTYTFDPAAAGAGVQSISYSYTNASGCTSAASDNVEVLVAPAVSIQQYNGLPFDEACLNGTATYSSSADAVGPPAVKTYTWAISNTTFTPNAGSPTAQDGTYERVDASWAVAGPQTVDLTVMYDNGCMQVAPQLSVNVNPAPAISCPANQTVQTSNNGTGDCTADATFTNPMDLNGACEPQTLSLSINSGMASTVTQGASNTQTLDLGLNTLSFVITDGGGNTDNCSFTITVEDDEAPMPACTDVTAEFNGEDELTVTIAELYDDASSTDNCGVVNLVSPTIDQLVTCDQLGDVIPVTIEVNDGNGNSNTCTANITVGGLPCGFMNTFGLGDCFDPNGNEADYDVPTGTFSLTSDGCNPAFPYATDDQSYIKYELCGDGVIDAFVSNIDGDGYAGIAMRESIDAGVRKVGIATNRVNRILKEIRVFPNYPAYPQQVLSYDKFWLRLERLNDFYFRAYASTDGVNYTPYIFQAVQMTGCLEIGLYVYSNTDGETVTADFTNVTITETTGNLDAGDMPYENGISLDPGLNIGLTPNPAKDKVNLDFSKLIGNEATIQIFNVNGQLMEERQIDAIERATETFAIERYPSGTYWINIQLATQQQTLKLIKQ